MTIPSVTAGCAARLGASLARVIMAEGFAALAERFPHLSLAGDESTVVWDDASFDGVVSLPVRTLPTP